MADALHVSVVKVQAVPPHACMLPLSSVLSGPFAPLHSGALGARGSTRLLPPICWACQLINLICLHLAYLSTVRNNIAQKSHDETVSQHCFRSTLSMSSFFAPTEKKCLRHQPTY